MTIKGQGSPPPVFGAPPQQYSQAWASSLTAHLTRRLGLLAGPYTIQPQLLLQSPDGQVWQITVSDTGHISAALAQRGDIVPPV